MADEPSGKIDTDAASKAQIEDLQNKLNKQANESESTRWIMNVLVIALLIGFAATFIAAAAMLKDAWSGKQVTYQALTDKIYEQSYKIDRLIQSQQSNAQPAPQPK